MILCSWVVKSQTGVRQNCAASLPKTCSSSTKPRLARLLANRKTRIEHFPGRRPIPNRTVKAAEVDSAAVKMPFHLPNSSIPIIYWRNSNNVNFLPRITRFWVGFFVGPTAFQSLQPAMTAQDHRQSSGSGHSVSIMRILTTHDCGHLCKPASVWTIAMSH